MARAHFPLAVVRRLVARDRLFCALSSVVEHFATPEDTWEAARETVLALRDSNFSET